MPDVVDIPHELDRIVDAFTDAGYACEWLFGEVDDREDWKTTVEYDGIIRTISSVNYNPEEDTVKSTCGDGLAAADCWFNVIAKDQRTAFNGLTAWIKQLYKTGDGNLGKPAGAPGLYGGVWFTWFRPVNGKMPVNARPQTVGNGSFYRASVNIEIIWETSNYDGESSSESSSSSSI